MKNFWLDKKRKKEFDKKIEYINKLLMQFNIENCIKLNEEPWELDV
jgi:hypothetical protein